MSRKPVQKSRTTSVGDTVKVSSDIRVAVFKRFRDENTEIPFPQRVIHRVNSEAAVDV